MAKLHIMEDGTGQVLCGALPQRAGAVKRKKVYETEHAILDEYENLRTKCKKCEQILKSRAGVSYERGGVYNKNWDYDKVERFYHGDPTKEEKFCFGCHTSKKRIEFTRLSRPGAGMRSKYCKACQSIKRKSKLRNKT